MIRISVTPPRPDRRCSAYSRIWFYTGYHHLPTLGDSCIRSTYLRICPSQFFHLDFSALANSIFACSLDQYPAIRGFLFFRKFAGLSRPIFGFHPDPHPLMFVVCFLPVLFRLFFSLFCIYSQNNSFVNQCESISCVKHFFFTTSCLSLFLGFLNLCRLHSFNHIQPRKFGSSERLPIAISI